MRAKTTLGSDEFVTNDEIEKSVRNVFPDDTGVLEIVTPNTGEGLSSEIVTVVISNFGTADQSNFDVNYSINGAAPVVETVTETLIAGDKITYSFNTLANISGSGNYNFTSSTDLRDDGDTSNDASSKLVENFDCTSDENTANVLIRAGSPAESIINVAENKIISDINDNWGIQEMPACARPLSAATTFMQANNKQRQPD